MEKKTALYEEHIAHGGKMVSFANYLLPVQYEGSGVVKEHMAVRQAAGMFDVSHMAEFLVSGDRAEEFVDFMITNKAVGMKDGQIRYTAMLYEEGGIVDDLLVYRMDQKRFMLVVNAANHASDYAWLKEYVWDGVLLEDISEQYAQLAVQGPRAMEIISQLVDTNDIPAKYYTFKEEILVDGISCLLSRNGYTGEDGVEIYVNPKHAVQLFRRIVEVGTPLGLIPCGLGARDTLRLEAAMPLYGHEMSATIMPKEAGLGIFVKMDKAAFVGKEALLEQPGSRIRVGLKMLDRGIAREHCLVYDDEQCIGEVSSGTHLPFVNAACAMAIINESYHQLGRTVIVDIRGRRCKAEIIALPFYKRP